MLKFNSFISRKYLRSRFVEGKFLLASEGTDLELELIDQFRRLIEGSIGDVAIGDSWKIERLSDKELLLKPGEAWFKGLPFYFENGTAHVVSGNVTDFGILKPTSGSSINLSKSDSATGLGKIIEFSDTVGSLTPNGIYRIVISAVEEIITSSEDQFLKNANITETTAQKVRVLYKINVVPEDAQTDIPVPYTNSAADGNLTNYITVTAQAGGNGELVASNAVSGSEEIDGINFELVITNDSTDSNPAYGGSVGNLLPQTPSDQQEYYNGKLIDSTGNEFHIVNIVAGDISTEVKIRLNKEYQQADPVITNGTTYQLHKREIFVTDDINGNPLGKLFWPVATVVWNTTNQFDHQSKITDLRSTIHLLEDFQEKTNIKFDLVLTGGGTLGFASDIVSWSSALEIVNPHGDTQTIDANSIHLIEDASIVYELDLETAASIALGNEAVTISSGGTTVALSGSPDLSAIRVGNLIKDSGGTVAYITEIDDKDDELIVSSALIAGAATIYQDAFQSGMAPSSADSYVLAVRNGGKIYMNGGSVEIEDGETTEIGDGFTSKALTYIGSTGEDDDDPNYSSTNEIVQGSDLTTAIGRLDEVAGNNITYTGADDGDDSTPDYSSNVYITDGEDLTVSVGKLDAAIGSTSGRDNQARTAKLIRGGTWSWVQATNTLTWSSNAFISIAGLAEDVNQLDAVANTDLDADGKVLYIDLKRTAGASSRTVNNAAVGSITLGDDTYVFARRVGNDVLIGNSFLLKDGELLELDGALAEINRYMGQLKLESTTSTNQLAIEAADETLLEGSILSQELDSFILDFAGDTIDFTTGTTVGATNISGLSAIGTEIPTVGHYKWFGIGLLPDTISAVDPKNLLTPQILITPAGSTNAVAGDAEFPNIFADKPLGAILVQNVAGAAVITTIRRLGVGAGGAGGVGGYARIFCNF